MEIHFEFQIPFKNRNKKKINDFENLICVDDVKKVFMPSD